MTRPDAPLVCIGGRSDGKRVACREDWMTAFTPPSMSEPLEPSDNVPVEGFVKTEHYRREKIICDGVPFYYWRHEKINNTAAIALLLQGYKRP